MDEHPDANIQNGAANTKKIIDALMNSTAWQDSVFILTFDEAGGLFVDGDASSHGFDGALSNFGGLNCIPSLEKAAAGLAACLRPGAVALLCIMGPLCPWEIAWYLVHGQLGTAFRRFRSGAEAHVGAGRTIRVWYPSPRRCGVV